MKIAPLLAAALLAFGLAATDAYAAKRFGGGGNLGKQRPAPTTMKEAAPATAPAAPAQAAGSPATAAKPAPATPPAQPSFMSRFGGLIAGLGIGALLGSLFGGSGIAGFLAMLLVAAIAFVAIRALMSRRASPAPGPVQFAGAGPGAGPADAPAARPALNIGGGVAAAAEAPRAAPVAIPGFEAEPFLRVAKTSFIRLQAANDAGDLDDIRDFTTPEMFAEIAMQVRDRGDAPQKTEVVSLDARLVEAVVEGDYAIASVRFTGLVREAADANPEPFDEVWHVRQDQRVRKATWLIAGIQQAA
ncbi:MAG: Tim44 domain-containing protein [Betaproteobacteria bacterium]|nr:Tim44 domain-containing protein [Betaproteobacteria bacterium]